MGEDQINGLALPRLGQLKENENVAKMVSIGMKEIRFGEQRNDRVAARVDNNQMNECILCFPRSLCARIRIH